jgi:hypothetical protein
LKNLCSFLDELGGYGSLSDEDGGGLWVVMEVVRVVEKEKVVVRIGYGGGSGGEKWLRVCCGGGGVC